MHSRGLGIDRLPHFLAAIIGRAYCEKKMAICELTNLLSSGFVGEAVRIFTRPAWRIRDVLLPHLKNVVVSRREDFARVLYLGGYDVEVPDIMRSDPRP